MTEPTAYGKSCLCHRQVGQSDVFRPDHDDEDDDEDDDFRRRHGDGDGRRCRRHGRYEKQRHLYKEL